MIRVGLVGFGMAGRVFHAPLISSVEGLELAAVVERNSDNAAERYPGITTYRSLDRPAGRRPPSSWWSSPRPTAPICTLRDAGSRSRQERRRRQARGVTSAEIAQLMGLAGGIGAAPCSIP